MSARSPNEPKRNSGKTGRRRLTPAELALREPKAATDHARRYGTIAAAVPPSLPDPPVWFTPELCLIWTQIIEAAPIGLLTAADHPAVVAYALAIFEHDRLARPVAARKTPAPAPLARQLRLLAAEVRAAASHLGLSIYQRTRINLPLPPPAEPVEFARFDVILPDGTRVPYERLGGRFKNSQES
jgi:hypothetical protein